MLSKLLDSILQIIRGKVIGMNEVLGIYLMDYAWLSWFKGPGPVPAAVILFFACPKKRTQKKGHPTTCPSSLMRGSLRFSRKPAVAELAANWVSPQATLN